MGIKTSKARTSIEPRFLIRAYISASFSAAITALNVASDSLLEEDSKAGRLVSPPSFPLSFDPAEKPSLYNTRPKLDLVVGVFGALSSFFLIPFSFSFL